MVENKNSSEYNPYIYSSYYLTGKTIGIKKIILMNSVELPLLGKSIFPTISNF